MFVDLCFLLSDHMCCGIIGDQLIASIGHKKLWYTSYQKDLNLIES